MWNVATGGRLSGLDPDRTVSGSGTVLISSASSSQGERSGLHRRRMVVLSGYSDVSPLRRTLWHRDMHMWCTPRQRACVVALLVAELRVDALDDDAWGSTEDDGAAMHVAGPLPPLPHDLWLRILEFVPRHRLGRRGD